jgi:hypothetical protein
MTWDGKTERRAFSQYTGLFIGERRKRYHILEVDRKPDGRSNIRKATRKEYDRRGKKTVGELNEFLKTQIGLAPEFLGKAIFKFLGKETNEQAS